MSPGQIAYEAYCARTGWKSAVSGAPLPQWDQQAQIIREAWECAAAAAIVARVMPPPGGEHYVLVVECDHAEGDGVPITWEHELGRGTTREAVEEHRQRVGTKYGRTRIARLVFEVEP